MNQSIHIDPKRISDWAPEKKGGTVVRHSISPYDIPEALTFWQSPDHSSAYLQFNYPGGPEPTIEKQLSTHVVAHEGKHTGRLYRIELKISDLVGNSYSVADLKRRVEQSLTEAIQALSHSLPQIAPPVRNRQDVSARVLTTVRDNYLDHLPR